MMDMLTEALTWQAAGYAPIPLAVDGTKRPAVHDWKTFITQPPNEDETRYNFTRTRPDGLGIITGSTSGQLEMFELEARAVDEGLLDQLVALLDDNGLTDLWAILTGGYVEHTPSGGLHWYYRVDGDAMPNTKLARRPATAAELAANPDERIKVLIETRGEGGFTVIAPSAGRSHPSGKAWTVITGSLHTIPTISVDARDALYAVVGMLDQLPDPEPASPPVGSNGAGRDGQLRPGDDYNQRASWDDILDGWTRGRKFGATCYGWTRPGKNPREGISATTGRNAADNLYVFSSSTPFDPETPYSKFAAYTLLHHDGDYAAAARQLRADGYGDQSVATPTLTLDVPAEKRLALVHSRTNSHPTDGSTALHIDQGEDIPRSIAVTLTDQGNTELFIASHGARLRYAPSSGVWLQWDGARWQWCEDDSEAVQAATSTIHAIQPVDDTERKHKARSLSRRALESITGLARRDQRIRIRADLLDADPWILNTRTGIVNLRTGQQRPADPAELCTKITGAGYDPTATAPRWHAFLTDTFGDDPAMLDFIQRLAGYSACGAVLHHILPFLHGGGGNGKTVFLDTLVNIFGDYASTAPAGFLMAGGREDENAVARLAGLRFVVCSEVNQSARFDEAKVKMLTGGDRLTARFLYHRHFTFVPSHTLWIMGNHQPRVDAGGEGFWRRLRLLPFTRTVPVEKRIEALSDLLVAGEATGILAWIVQGAQKALADGLKEPQSVLAATSAYAEEEDSLARFLLERCHVGGGRLVRVSTADMRSTYTGWCHEEGEKEVTPQVFGRELRSRLGLIVTRSHGRKFYENVTLLSSENEPDQEPHWSDR